MSKRMIGYVRCSTQEQADSRLGIKSQRGALEDYCERHEYELVDIVEDLGVSAKGHDLASRLALQELVERLSRALNPPFYFADR